MIPTTFPILDFSKKLLNIQPGYTILILGGGVSLLVCVYVKTISIIFLYAL